MERGTTQFEKWCTEHFLYDIVSVQMGDFHPRPASNWSIMYTVEPVISLAVVHALSDVSQVWISWPICWLTWRIGHRYPFSGRNDNSLRPTRVHVCEIVVWLDCFLWQHHCYLIPMVAMGLQHVLLPFPSVAHYHDLCTIQLVSNCWDWQVDGACMSRLGSGQLDVDYVLQRFQEFPPVLIILTSEV